jgi:hypothetical protein
MLAGRSRRVEDQGPTPATARLDPGVRNFQAGLDHHLQVFASREPDQPPNVADDRIDDRPRHHLPTNARTRWLTILADRRLPCSADTMAAATVADYRTGWVRGGLGEEAFLVGWTHQPPPSRSRYGAIYLSIPQGWPVRGDQNRFPVIYHSPRRRWVGSICQIQPAV